MRAPSVQKARSVRITSVLMHQSWVMTVMYKINVEVMGYVTAIRIVTVMTAGPTLTAKTRVMVEVLTVALHITIKTLLSGTGC